MGMAAGQKVTRPVLTLQPPQRWFTNKIPRRLYCKTASSGTLAFSMLQLATWNLRYDSKPDEISVEESLRSLPGPLQPPSFRNVSGERPWSRRRIEVARIILREDLHVIGESSCWINCGFRNRTRLIPPGYKVFKRLWSVKSMIYCNYWVKVPGIMYDHNAREM